MTDPTRTTGATAQQIEMVAQFAYRLKTGKSLQHFLEHEGGDERVADVFREIAKGWLGKIVTEDQCIVPRSFVSAVDAAISEAEELDYSPPYIRIPLGKWHDVANARDTFREATS